VSRYPTPSFRADGPGTAAQVWRSRLSPDRADALTLDGVTRVVVVAAHPGDESLGAAGLVATAVAAGLEAHLVCVTDGEASHPESPTHGPADLGARRTAEWAAAAGSLGVDPTRLLRLQKPDGDVDRHLAEVTTALVDLVGDGADTVIASPWSEDGHPDHAAVGRCAAATAHRTGAQLWEFPVWFWHWGDPADPRAERLRPFPVSSSAASAKTQAVAAHRSQIGPLSSLEGD
jgi:LmbE family N-acetylglucosaminyl deacetylase